MPSADGHGVDLHTLLEQLPPDPGDGRQESGRVVRSILQCLLEMCDADGQPIATGPEMVDALRHFAPTARRYSFESFDQETYFLREASRGEGGRGRPAAVSAVSTLVRDAFSVSGDRIAPI